MLSRLRESLALILLALLPFHALLVTVLTKLIAGPEQRPLPVLAIWKEIILLLILVLAFGEILSRLRKRQLAISNWLLAFDAIDWAIAIAFAWSILLTISQLPIAKSQLLGFKYDFLPLIAFFILRRVAWSDMWKKRVMNILLIDAVILSVYGIAALFLPMEFFTALGYSDLHSLYLSDGSLAPFQQLGGSSIRRMQSAMSGPNQLGLWMLLPLGILLTSFGKGLGSRVRGLAICFILIAIILSFSRAAWIAAIVMAVSAWWMRSAHPKKIQRAATVGGGMLLVGIIFAFLFPSAFLRFQSTSDHLRRPVEALRIIAAHPFGLGLGSAGPASNAVSDTCVDLPSGADASWAEGRSNLCVFVGGTQVQPAIPCHCPLLTENWYLQWGVEMGWLGLVLSVMLPFFVLRKLKMQNAKCKITDGKFYIVHCTFYIFLSYLGLSIAGLFLHSFEDAAVAYSIWLLLGSPIGLREVRPNAR